MGHSKTQREEDLAHLYRIVYLHGNVLAIEIIYHSLGVSIDQPSD
jgi:hypothetical protein